MDTERKWEAIAPRVLTSDGGAYGQVDIASTVGFKVKQKVLIKSNTNITLTLEVKQVQSDTRLIVGPQGKINLTSDLTGYLVADSATIEARIQDRSNIDIKQHERAVYAEEPIMAKRVIPVDRIGKYFSTLNPFPVQVTSSPPVGSANTPTITEFTIAAASTEVNHVLPENTKYIRIKVRGHSAVLRISFSSGGTSSNYITIPRGSTYEKNDLNTPAGLTLYFQVDRPNQILEIETWK